MFFSGIVCCEEGILIYYGNEQKANVHVCACRVYAIARVYNIYLYIIRSNRIKSISPVNRKWPRGGMEDFVRHNNENKEDIDRAITLYHELYNG